MAVLLYKPYKIYKTVSKKGYRKVIIWEGQSEVKPETPYLLDGKEYDVDVSIVAPCYNEHSRLPPTFEETYKVSIDFTH